MPPAPVPDDLLALVVEGLEDAVDEEVGQKDQREEDEGVGHGAHVHDVKVSSSGVKRSCGVYD